jgi:hypothetical protein
MHSAIKTIKSKAQGSQNAKKIQNYTYYPDRVIGSGNFSTVYDASSLTTRTR